MFSGLTNNREIGLRLGIRASQKGVDGSRHCRLSCNSNLPLLKTSSNFDRHFTETVCREVNYLTSSRIPTTPTCGVSMHVKQVVYLTVNQHGTLPFTKKSVNWQNRTVEKPWGMLSLFTHFRSLQVAFTGRRSFWKTMIRFQLFKWIDPARGCDTEM